MGRLTVADLRDDEMRYRRRGYFVAADNARRAADMLEFTPESTAYVCCVLDRGAILPLDCFEIDGVVALPMNNGTSYAVTPDRAVEVAQTLLYWAVPEFAEALWGAE